MKFLSALPLLVLLLVTNSNTISFRINGTIKNTENAKFAYLTTRSQQIPISSDKIFMVTPIVNGHFEFRGTFNLEDKNFQQACVFIDSRGNITKEELASRFKQQTLTTSEPNFKRIILEDLSLNINKRDEMKLSTVSKDGTLTRQLEEVAAATRLGSKNLADFVKSHPDSPLSLNAISTYVMSVSDGEPWGENGGTPLELFEKLTNRIKSSKQGIELKKRLQ